MTENEPQPRKRTDHGVTREIVVRDDAAELVAAIDNRFESVVAELLATQKSVNIVLTGGTVGIALLRPLDTNNDLDWSRIHVWWGDERWLPAGHADRNEGQATEALLKRLNIPPENVHRFAASDGGLTLDQAAREYQSELESFAPQLRRTDFLGAGYNGSDVFRTPIFDITFLGVGPDAHVASLFPGLEGVAAKNSAVIAVRDSPKPPAERLSLTLPVINASCRIWIVAAGEDKADAVNHAFTRADAVTAPVSGVHGTLETVLFADAAAVSLLT
jgi:6-phosphogluconolactonase